MLLAKLHETGMNCYDELTFLLKSYKILKGIDTLVVSEVDNWMIAREDHGNIVFLLALVCSREGGKYKICCPRRGGLRP